MLEFQLFRIIVKYNRQTNLFIQDLPTPQKLLSDIIKSTPSFENIKGTTWHIGNILPIDKKSLYFRFGKTTVSTLELYEEGNFMDVDFETSPYTHIFLDTDLELCAIAQKTKVAQTQKGISFRFRDLLNYSPQSQKDICTYEINELDDPEDFIDHLKSAHSIKKFWVKLSPPNAWDVDEDFTKPLQKIQKEINAQQSKAEFVGEDLDPQILETISRTAASLGEAASARIQKRPKSPPITIRLEGAKMTIAIDEQMVEAKKKEIIDELRKVYYKIKGRIN